MVTTPAIAEAFAKETDYFNTFGGNPVSATAGKAVLEIVTRENLLANVKASGDHMLTGFGRLAEKHPIIGDIRGKGLFLTVELVRYRTGRARRCIGASQLAWRNNRLHRPSACTAFSNSMVVSRMKFRSLVESSFSDSK